MLAIDQQLHGYRHGHELLSTSVKLSAGDQDLIDRLSDVAGPLGPDERFSPYLTCYPLPSGSHYVVARTWQDVKAPRAGCVRTRSLLVPMADWRRLKNPAALAEEATRAGPNKPAERSRLDPMLKVAIPPIEGAGTEMLEALFLEERAPIAVFDAERPELMALRLLTAFWPSYRRNFSLSTFCRSPRTISRKSFDLVFAPADARSHFTEWKGRRIDGSRRSGSRHHWSGSIADRIFRASEPSLSGLDVLGEMAGDERGSEEALRVSLLWNELQSKVETSPHAALSLLDIVNTRTVRNADVIRQLEPALARAAKMATTSMPAVEGWRFLGALTEKLQDSRLTLSVAKAIRAAAMRLSEEHPPETLAAISTFGGEAQRELLTGAAGEGLARVLDAEVADGLHRLDGDDLLTLLLASPTLAEKAVARYPIIATDLVEPLGRSDGVRLDDARRRLLRLMSEDVHVDAFTVLISSLDGPALVAETIRLHGVNRLSAAAIRDAIVKRAFAISAVETVRDAAADLGEGAGVDAMVTATLRPTSADVSWILKSPPLSVEGRLAFLLRLVRLASADQLRDMLAVPPVLAQTVELLSRGLGGNADALAKIAQHVAMSPEAFIDLALLTVGRLAGRAAAELAARGLEVALPCDLGQSRAGSIEVFLGAAGSALDGGTALRVGLERGVSAAVADRNVMAFNRAPPASRARILRGMESMARALVGRSSLDLSSAGVEAAAALLWDSDPVDHQGFVRGSAILLPFLMNARNEPASPLIAAAFPPVYRELQKERLPDFLGFVFIFLDWDRCKIARRNLAEAFAGSRWRPADIALAAARAGDAEKILKRIARGDGGTAAIKSIRRDIDTIPTPWRKNVQSALRAAEKGDPLFGGLDL